MYVSMYALSHYWHCFFSHRKFHFCKFNIKLRSFPGNLFLFNEKHSYRVFANIYKETIRDTWYTSIPHEGKRGIDLSWVDLRVIFLLYFTLFAIFIYFIFPLFRKYFLTTFLVFSRQFFLSSENYNVSQISFIFTDFPLPILPWPAT